MKVSMKRILLVGLLCILTIIAADIAIIKLSVQTSEPPRSSNSSTVSRHVTEHAVHGSNAANIKALNEYEYSRGGKKHGLYIEEIFLALKSSKRFHKQRVGIILDTWYNYAQSSVYILTDGDDPSLAANFGKSGYYTGVCFHVSY
ncbi:MFNG [Bugula neritina]|uniref:MFNG n=1 Tax=Bugula neritina TaxID=10212 RepID=A0A7J7KJW0_BUGNE|nr:MFNG [Bugula neritina]